jgi:hypothetical protein
VPVLVVSSAATAVALTRDGGSAGPQAGADPAGSQATKDVADERARELPVSRSAFDKRESLDLGPVLTVDDVDTKRKFATADLNVWSGPGEKYKLRTELELGSKLAVTGVETKGWAQIVFKDTFAWVNADYVAKHKPEPEQDAEKAEDAAADLATGSGGVTEAPCPLGSGVEAGLTPDAIRVYRSVCAQFPSVTSYGGVRADSGEHGTGQALDIMVTGSTGDAIAEWVRANASALGVSEVLWAQRIWTVERSSEGWRYFEDRGSATANHFDHVHVTVYGSSGG